MNNLTEAVGKFFLWLIVGTIEILIGGFVFTKLWLWFIVPIFPLEPLTIGQAIGLSFFIGYLKLKKSDLENEESDEYGFGYKLLKGFIITIVVAAFILGLGWILSLFM